MALVARPVAHAARGGARDVMRLARLAVLALVTLAVVAACLSPATAAEPLDVRLGPYLEAMAGGDVGTVTGRVYEERRRPQEPDRPVASAMIVLVPHSEALVRRFEELKRRSRESATAFREAAPGMRRAKEEYETALWQAGAPQLAIVVATDADGSFRVPELPAGAWLLVGWHAQMRPTSAPKRTKREQGLYTPGRRVIGFEEVQVWMRPVTVGRGASERVELTDRNVWFSGVEEDTMLDAGR